MQLEIDALETRHPGVSEGLAQSYAEAASVCLDRHHTPPVQYDLSDNGSSYVADLQWSPASPRLLNAWNNRDDATEFGAYGLALAAIEVTRGLVAVARAATRSGADYLLSEPGQEIEDFENCLRLEVSGTDKGDVAAIGARLRAKLQQAERGESDLPAIASVVGFLSLRVSAADLR